MSITVHCLVKNEENFIWYAIKSVVDFVDKIIIFDTGSEDKTVEIIKKLMTEYPNKIIFEEKGPADKERHTVLRNEMIEKTQTDWFMILDGDEVWSASGIKEAVNCAERGLADCLIAPFYLCVGDIFHYSPRGAYMIHGQLIHATPRLFRRLSGIHWQGSYDNDVLVDEFGNVIFEKESVEFLKNKFWHLSHLRRSSVDDATYSSGINRKKKRRLTYFLIGKKIRDVIPEVFKEQRSLVSEHLAWSTSLVHFMRLAADKIHI